MKAFFYNRSGSSTQTVLDSSAEINEDLGILNNGKNNKFPVEILKKVQYSSTTTSCLAGKHKFIRGNGFTDPSLDKLKANPRETLKTLDAKIAKDQTYFGGAYYLFKYNREFKISSIQHLPFENTRIIDIDEYGNPTGFKYNPMWGVEGEEQNNDPELITIYDSFNPDREYIQSKVEQYGGVYNGQVLLIKEENPQKRIYPVPTYISAINWIEIDHKIGLFHKNNIENDFMLGMWFKMVGDPSEIIEPETDTKKAVTVGELFHDQMEESFAGEKNGGTSMVTWSDNSDEFPEIEPFPQSGNEKLFIVLEDLTKKNIVQAMGIPNILVNIETAGKLGSSQEMSNTVAFMNGNTEEYRAMREGVYSLVLPEMAQPITATVEIKKFEYQLDGQTTDNVGGLPTTSNNI